MDGWLGVVVVSIGVAAMYYVFSKQALDE